MLCSYVVCPLQRGPQFRSEGELTSSLQSSWQAMCSSEKLHLLEEGAPFPNAHNRAF